MLQVKKTGKLVSGSSFTNQQEEDHNFIVCPPNIDPSIEKELEIAIKQWQMVPVDLHILDFASVRALHPNLVRHFVLFKNNLKKYNKKLATINMSKHIYQQIAQSGLSEAFAPVSDINEARRKAGMEPKKGVPKIDAIFLRPFISATKHVLETQASTSLTPGKPYVKKEATKSNTKIAGVISMSCQQFKGSIAVCFPEDVFLKIYENMVGEVHESINPEVQDAAGEILNIIFGQAKTVLMEKGYKLERAIPTVLTGDDLSIHYKSPVPVLVLPFESSAGSFIIEILVDED